ncbi:mechanosensitive ion channel family protein [Sphingobium sp. H33]|uniref:Mechanosensitive ion channel family protein n=2 Tax=Sphingobium nicotianae TaxID=2782607 RepID=A0A9X1D8G8_9SPHN|nr:mechanosensitive ion channel domain-containing protein [Sphingobium nicotianae]MBT2185434.1 mechanosensitive ion channel family protein [Sphingobium nicotianae]
MDDISNWLAVHWLQIALAIGAGIAIYLALNFLRELVKRVCQREYVPGLVTVAGRAARKTGHFFMMLVAARLVAGYANPPELVLATINFLFTISAAFQVAIWLREIIVGLVERRAGQEGAESLAMAMGIIRILVSVAVFAIAAIVVLDNLGVNVTGLVAGLGIGGIAIGLAAQGIFADLFAALSILFDKPFRQGDVITYDQTTARVVRIGLKSTRLRAVTGERKVISNANLLQKEITGQQRLESKRVKFTLGIVYQTPIELIARIPEILRQVVEVEGQVYVHAGMVAFGTSSLDFELEFDVPDPDDTDYFMSRHRVALSLLRRFNEEGIAFAYPTQTSFTAAPDGQMIMPYPQPAKTTESPARRSARQATSE